MAITLKRMKARLEEFEVKIDRLEGMVEHYRAVIADLEDLEKSEEESAVNMDDEMERIFVLEGSPLHFKTVYQKLLDRGVKVAGEDPSKNTGAHLSLDYRCVSSGGGIWGLTEWGEHEESEPVSIRTMPNNVATVTDPVNTYVSSRGISSRDISSRVIMTCTTCNGQWAQYISEEGPKSSACPHCHTVNALSPRASTN